MEQTKIIECPHKNKLKYIYEIGKEIEVHLCDCCNMNLAGEVMKQMALETFCPKEEE